MPNASGMPHAFGIREAFAAGADIGDADEPLGRGWGEHSGRG